MAGAEVEGTGERTDKESDGMEVGGRLLEAVLFSGLPHILVIPSRLWYNVEQAVKKTGNERN